MPSREDPLLTVTEVAKKAGWSRQRMLRHLKTADAQLGGMLLRRYGTGKNAPYHVAASALEALHPQWGVSTRSLAAKVEDLETRLFEQDELARTAHKLIVEMQRANQALVKRVEDLERRRPA